MDGTIYLLHFSAPLGNPQKPHGQAQHYVGWALDLAARLAEHRAGAGASITRAAVERGITFEVVRTWQGDRTLERKIKNRKMAPRLCPLCGSSHTRRGAPAAQQLDLAFGDDDLWPAASQAWPVDWFELTYFRRALPRLVVAAGGDIPY